MEGKTALGILSDCGWRPYKLSVTQFAFGARCRDGQETDGNSKNSLLLHKKKAGKTDKKATSLPNLQNKEGKKY